MVKNNRGKYFILAISLMFILLMTACAGVSTKEEVTEQSAVSYGANNYAAANYSYDGAAAADEGTIAADGLQKSEEAGDASGAGNSSILSEDTAAAEGGRKLIHEASLDVETKDFDAFTSKLAEEVEEFGGYLEYSSVGGSSYLSEGSQRTAWYTARIPEAQLDAFLAKIGDNGNITNLSKNVRDITLEYVDVAGRISSLEAELSRLNELLEQASSMEDILAIESKISDVRYELESYQSQMNTYDNLIDYSTVNISVLEVDVVSAGQRDSAWKQIQSGFMNSLYGLGRGLSSFIIGLLSSIPYLVVLAVVIIVVTVLVRKAARKRRGKKNERLAQQSETDKKDE